MPLRHDRNTIVPRPPLEPMRESPQVSQHVSEPRHDELARVTAQDLVDDTLGNSVHLQRRHHKRRRVSVALEERGLGVPLVDNHRAHLGRVVQGSQLRAEPLVEAHRRRLSSSVIHHPRHGDERRDRRDGDDHAVVAGDQAGQELLGQDVVRDGVDVEGEADVLLGALEDGLSACDTGVEDEDGGVADGAADLSGDRGDGGRVGDVALEVVDVGG